MIMKKFNFRFKDKRQLDRTCIEETKEKAIEYMKKKYPNRIIVGVKEYKEVEELNDWDYLEEVEQGLK